MSGKTIDLYLMNGKADSVVRARLSNWSGVAYKIPYAEVKDCNLDKIHSPGVYFLFGEEGEQSTCYVGESDDTLNRLKQHLNDSDPWKTAVAFLGDDLDTTKIICLEDKCFTQLKKSNRCKVLTKQTDSKQHINDEIRDIADEFLKNMMIVLPVLGFNALEPVVNSSEVGKKNTLYLDIAGIKATGAETAEGFVVFTGSKVTLNPAQSLPENAKRKREYLLKSGIIQEDTFINNYVFNSSSEAAAVVIGYGISGPQSWHYEDGTTLKQANEKAANQSN